MSGQERKALDKDAVRAVYRSIPTVRMGKGATYACFEEGWRAALATCEEPTEVQIEEAARLIYGGVGPVAVCIWECVDEPSKVRWRGIAQVVLRGAFAI